MPHRALRSREAGRVPLVATLLVVTVALLLAFGWATMAALHATSIYAQGQARWIEAHARATMHLHRYARSGNPMRREAALAALRPARAFQRAREALTPPDVNRETAVAAFVEGGLAPPDAERAATFARLFRYSPPARRTLGAWREGDEYLDSLTAYATEMRLAHERGDSTALRLLVQRLDESDTEVARLEEVFSEGLADAARTLPPLLLTVGILLGLLLVAIGVVTVHGVARAADRLRAAENEQFLKLRALMEGLPDVILWYDRSHRITYVNRAMEQVTGLPRTALLGRTYADLLRQVGAPEEAVAAGDPALDRAFAGEDDVVIVVEGPSATGEVRVFQSRFVPQRNADGDVESVVVIGRDITAVRDSEAALRERDAQLQHGQKLEAVGRLAGGVAHEFNNILTAITANLELALLTLPEGNEARQDLHAALTAARRASGLTRQLLAFGRRDPVERRLVDVGRVVAELDLMLRRLAGEQVEIHTTVPPTPATAMADPAQLQQILLNLVSNARDAMPGGGTVRIGVATVAAEALEHHPGTLASGTPTSPAADAAPAWVTITVADSGAGMDDATVQRLFEPFFTTKPPGSGTGLGLPVVNGIVTQLGGRIYLETAPGQGTRFTIALPAAASIPRNNGGDGSPVTGITGEVETVSSAVMPAARGETVLLVEDEAPVRAATRRMLESVGYRVVEAQHGEEALARWAKTEADIVVTDYMMPGVSGGELVERLRTTRPELPALIVSGYTGGDVIDVGRLGGRTAMMPKPFTRADLLRRVRELLDTRA